MALAEALAPHLFAAGDEDRERATRLRRELLDAVYLLGAIDDQAAYEDAHDSLANQIRAIDVPAIIGRTVLTRAMVRASD